MLSCLKRRDKDIRSFIFLLNEELELEKEYLLINA